MTKYPPYIVQYEYYSKKYVKRMAGTKSYFKIEKALSLMAWVKDKRGTAVLTDLTGHYNFQGVKYPNYG